MMLFGAMVFDLYEKARKGGTGRIMAGQNHKSYEIRDQASALPRIEGCPNLS